MKDEDGSDIEQYSEGALERRQTEAVDRRGNGSLARSERDSQPSGRPGERGVVTELADSLRSVTVETESVTATLMGIPRVDIHEYVYDHQLGVDHEPDETRAVAMFDLENTGSYPVTWRSSRTRFIGTDGYTYRPAQLSLDPSSLGPGCHTRQVEIEPNRRARVLTLVEQLPGGVDVAEVVHKLTTYGDSQRLAFVVE